MIHHSVPPAPTPSAIRHHPELSLIFIRGGFGVREPAPGG